VLKKIKEGSDKTLTHVLQESVTREVVAPTGVALQKIAQ